MGATSEKKNLLQEFTAKASQRLRDKKLGKTTKLHVPSMDVDIIIRDLKTHEITEVLDVEDTMESTRYCAYIGILEPNMQQLAKELKASGDIYKPVDAVDIFEMHEVNEIAEEILKLSGVTAEKGAKVKAVEDLKN